MTWNRPSLRLALAILSITVLTACSGSPGGTETATETAAPVSSVRLSYAGCGITKKAFMEELAKAFKAKTGIEIDIAGGGATKGITNASTGTADLGGGCRHKVPGPEEANARQVHVAWDALVAIVHPENPVDNLSSDQLRGILTGEIRTWSAVGGDSAVLITVAARSGKISGVGRIARELIFRDPAADYVANAITYPSSGPLEQAIEESRTMIGVTGVSSARKRGVKILSIDGIEPSYENIASGTYPYVRPLFIYIGSSPSKETQAFIDFARSPEGQAVIRSQGSVTLEDGKALAGSYAQKMLALNLPQELWQLTEG
ncbi:MAG: substrate-binding domain-containing protein [Acidobacteria bacterium]|nr:substrate-binding domain-containing protein [Acidobacteriota bacterium]